MSFHEKFGFWADVIVETSFNNSLLIMAIINGSDFNDNNTIRKRKSSIAKFPWLIGQTNLAVI
ncbi:hypothetical protein [Nostoc sp.]|uniref:hypothetical protein n=1 Tax=Nostoc sp. TaxID=1180 RepID=UPI002FFA6154